MRYIFKPHKILSVLNLLLLAILGVYVLNLILKDTKQEDVAKPKDHSIHADIEHNQISSDIVNPEIILERNIFSPIKTDESKNESQREKHVAQSAKLVTRKQLELRLLGTVAGKGDVSCAIVQDTRTSVQNLYKTGDVIHGARIDKIERNRIILLNEGVREVLNLYVASGNSTVQANKTQKIVAKESSLADAIKVTSPTEREVNKHAFFANIGGIEAVLKTVEFSPYIVNGRAEGLQINGLEGLSMARYVGLENGDVIQNINGQIIKDNRKAYQVLRKARALSALDIQIMRADETKMLSFKIA
jgi:type II secretion system protein C